jgi:hypothetical protein
VASRLAAAAMHVDMLRYKRLFAIVIEFLE